MFYTCSVVVSCHQPDCGREAVKKANVILLCDPSVSTHMSPVLVCLCNLKSRFLNLVVHKQHICTVTDTFALLFYCLLRNKHEIMVFKTIYNNTAKTFPYKTFFMTYQYKQMVKAQPNRIP